MAWGIQNLDKIYSFKYFKIVRWSLCLQGIASTHLETLSTTTKILRYPKDEGKGPIKSMPQQSNS